MPMPAISGDLARRARPALLPTGVFALVCLLYLLPVLDPATLGEHADVWSDVPLIAVAAALALWRRPLATDPRERVFWLAIGGGLACWLTGRIGWALLSDGQVGGDLAADFSYLLFYIGILVALEMDPDGPAPRPAELGRRRLTIAGGIVLLVTAYAYFAMIPALVSPASYESWKPSVVGTLAFDLYVTIQLVRRLRAATDERWRRIYRWLVAAFAYWVVIDTVDVIWLYVPIPALDPGSPLDLVWLFPYTIFWAGLLAGRVAPTTHAPAVAPARLATPGAGTPLVAYAFSLPLLHVLLRFLGMSDPVLDPARGMLLVGESVLLAGLILRTHGMIVAENRVLHQDYEDASSSLSAANRELEQRVEKRTAELAAANRRLVADLDERIRIEQQLTAAQERNRALILAVPDTLVQVDAEGIVRAVHPGQADCGLVLPAHVGRPLTELLPCEAAEQITAALRDGGTGPGRIIPLGEPAAGRHVELRVGRCGVDEYLVLLQDVTNRHEFEAALQQSQRLESLGVLAGGIAHDFNNLLTIIIGNTHLAQEEAADTGALAHSLAAIEASARRAAKLTANLLAYAGEAHVEVAPVDMVSLIDEMGALLGTVVSGRVTCAVNCDPGPLWVSGNDAQLTQVLLNLVQNATEAVTGPDGKVQLELAACTMDSSSLADMVHGAGLEPGEYVRVLVRDNGSGMAPAAQSRVFEPFYTSKGAGRGLGLAAVLGIIRKHRGALTLASAPGQGTTFGVYLPVRAAPAKATAASASGRPKRLQGVVLVADDEEQLRSLLARQLGGLGFEVLEAADGAEAVTVARSHGERIAVVIMDYLMPKLNGIEAMRIIRSERPGLPVIMMSGYGEHEALTEAVATANTSFLEKPFDLADLVNLLSNCPPLAGGPVSQWSTEDHAG